MVVLRPKPPESRLQLALWALIAGLIVWALAGLAGLTDGFDRSISGHADALGWKATSFMAFVLLSGALAGIEFGHRRVAWLALPPGLFGVVALTSALMGGTSFDSWLARAFTSDVAVRADPAAPLAAFSLVAGAGALLWIARPRFERGRALGVALIGSLLVAASGATLTGYLLNLPAAYRWGMTTGLPPSIAMSMLLLGVVFLLHAWREHSETHDDLPAWIPLPVIVCSAMISVILWAVLEERENAYLASNTQISLNTLANAIGREFERQSTQVERLARRLYAGNIDRANWEADAFTWLGESPGAQSLAQLGADYRTRWYAPEVGNEALAGLDHRANPGRRAALEEAVSGGAPVVSPSLLLPAAGPGFAIYVPVRERNAVTLLAAEFTYRRFFERIEKAVAPDANHYVTVYVGGERVYESAPALATVRRSATLEAAYSIQERRIRLVLTPTADYLERTRRNFPELAVAAGLGITALLGLSVHLARKASTGLRAAGIFNRRLVAENEERRRVEGMLKISDERLRLALDSTAIGIFEWNLETQEIHYSDGLLALLGFRPGDIAGTPEAWQALIHPNDVAGYRAATSAQLNGAQPFIDPEYRLRNASGDWRWVYARSRLVAPSRAGAGARVVGTIQDITSRKESERALRRSQAATRKLSLVASRTDNLVIIASPDGTIEWVNESFERHLEWSLTDVVGRNPADFLIGPATNRRTVRRIRAAMARGEGISTDIVNYSKSGRLYHMHLEVQPVRNELGALETFIGVQTDITARVETENALRRAKADADAASRAKSEFLASMSHEIRTPMNGVIGMTTLLLDTPLTPEQHDCVSTIRSSGETLLTVINDILDFSKAESGKLELERRAFDLAAAIEEMFDLFAVQAATKRLELAHCLAPDVPALVVGDVTRLRQVLINLVNNAIKFTPAGRVSVEVRLLPPAADDATGRINLEFAVSDTGIGMPAEGLDRLFKPFSQIDSSTTRKFGGTGLGLAISERLCRLMGGTISVISEVGHGSTFTFTVSLEPAPTADQPSAPSLPAALRKGPVLCVDDNPVTLRRLVTFFEGCGCEVRAAPTASAALEVLGGAIAPSAALVDFDLAASVEARPLRQSLTARGLPVLGLLAAGQTSSPPWALPQNFLPLGKPLKTAALVRTLHALFNSEPAPAAKEAVAEPRPLAESIPLRILLVEDNPVNQKVALRFLDRLGYRADAVANGREALSALGRHPYGLVFMDLQMPEMDGFEAARLIRETFPTDSQPKIIALTANALQGDRDKCLAVGMDDFITKPVKLHEIAEAIRRQFMGR